MEYFFLAILILILAASLGSGYPVALAIPGSAILTIGLAAISGLILYGDTSSFFVNSGGPKAWLSAGVLNFRSIYRSDDGDTLIAIPIFIFMGAILQHSKIAEDLLVAMSKVLGLVRGGLGVSVVLVGALLAATTSVIGATVATVGTISLPSLLKNGYPKPLAAGLVAATGTLGQIVPPSIVLVILAHQLSSAVNRASGIRKSQYKDVTGDPLMPTEFDVVSVSASEIFIGALIPGLLLVALYIFYVVLRTLKLPKQSSSVEPQVGIGLSQIIALFGSMFAPLVLILLVLGSIIGGVATINQAAAIGSAGALILAGNRLYEGRENAGVPALIAVSSLISLWAIMSVFEVNIRRIETGHDTLGVALASLATVLLVFSIVWSGLRVYRVNRTMTRVVDETLRTTCLVFAILLGAVMLTAAFRGFGGEELVRQYLQSLPGGFWGQFAVAMLIIFILGFFLDFIEITVLIVPIIAPILLANPTANITAVWLGVMIAMNIQTSFLTPPFGFALFYLRGVASASIRTLEIYKGVVPFIGIQLLGLAIVGAFPSLVNYLPVRTLFLSDAAPSPSNPKLQVCLEAYVSQELLAPNSNILKSISKAKSFDLQALPRAERIDFLVSIENTELALKHLAEIADLNSKVSVAAETYRPVLREVRTLQREIAQIDSQLKRLKTSPSQVKLPLPESVLEQNRNLIVALTVSRRLLSEKIPAGWDIERLHFLELQNAEDTERRAYRKKADAAFGSLQHLIMKLETVPNAETALEKLRSIRIILESEFYPDATAELKLASQMLAPLSVEKRVAKLVRQSSKAVRSGRTKILDAKNSLDEAISLLEEEISWRSRASSNLLPSLQKYRASIANTIGVRRLPDLPKAVARELITCSASPPDLSLRF